MWRVSLTPHASTPQAGVPIEHSSAIWEISILTVLPTYAQWRTINTKMEHTKAQYQKFCERQDPPTPTLHDAVSTATQTQTQRVGLATDLLGSLGGL